MSVKMMTTESIHADLASIHNMWSGGIPPEQQDRVNALRSELKRRGVDQKPVSPVSGDQQMTSAIEGMTDDQLSKELMKLSERIAKNPQDDESQTRFADVRFELRRRKGVGQVSNGNGQLAQSEPKPDTNGQSSFEQGAVSRHTTEMPSARVQALQQEFIAKQEERQRQIEETIRKANIAKIAAEVTAVLLAKHADPNGDDIENCCVIGLQVAANIYAKVGL